MPRKFELHSEEVGRAHSVAGRDAVKSLVQLLGRLALPDRRQQALRGPVHGKTSPRFPLLLTTGRILSQYNVGAQTRRTDNVAWHHEDRLEIHPHDAAQRGIRDGDRVRLASRAGETTLRALITERLAPGMVYTTFHHPGTLANVATTDYSDWPTNCS